MNAKKKPDGKRFEFDNMFRSGPVLFGSVELYQIGELCCEPTFEIASHRQWCHEISYIISGNAEFYIDEKRIEANPGDIIITPKGRNHRISAGNTGQLYFAYIGFDFAESAAENEQLEDFYKTRADKIKDRLNIYEVIKKCIDEFYETSQTSKIMVESLLNQIIVLAYRNSLQSSARKKSGFETDEGVGNIVYRIIKYVDKNIFEIPGVSLISAELGYSTYYISHIFKEKMGVTLQQYINNQRIEKSKELISLNKFSITAVAEKLNYSNLQSFSRAFKRTTGIYPSDYVKSNK